MAKKPSLGRQKIKIAKIEKPNHRQVTFSKRRSGLFKKACELCTLCGVEIAIIVYSPASKVFSFGHPNVESLVDRFLLSKAHRSNTSVLNFGGDNSVNASVRELNSQLTHVINMCDEEKERKETLIEESDETMSCWWEKPVETLRRSELELLSGSLEELKKNVVLQTRLIDETTSSLVEPKMGSSDFVYGQHGFGSYI